MHLEPLVKLVALIPKNVTSNEKVLALLVNTAMLTRNNSVTETFTGKGYWFWRDI